MRFYNQACQCYCGIDLHVKTMYVCILDAAGQVLVHRNVPSTPEAFLTIAPHPCASSATRDQAPQVRQRAADDETPTLAPRPRSSRAPLTRPLARAWRQRTHHRWSQSLNRCWVPSHTTHQSRKRRSLRRGCGDRVRTHWRRLAGRAPPEGQDLST